MSLPISLPIICACGTEVVFTDRDFFEVEGAMRASEPFQAWYQRACPVCKTRNLKCVLVTQTQYNEWKASQAPAVQDVGAAEGAG